MRIKHSASLLLLSSFVSFSLSAQSAPPLSKSETVSVSDQSTKNTPTLLPPTTLHATTLMDLNVGKNREGNDTLRLTFSDQAPNIELKQFDNKIVLNLKNADIASVVFSKTLPSSIILTPKGPNNETRVEISLNKEAIPQAIQTNNAYILDLVPKNKPVTSTSPSTNANNISAKRYTGRAVSFNFQDVPVRTVLQLLAEEAGLNIVVSDTVQGNVTLRLVNIPWDQALDIVLQAKGLDQRRNNKVVWVGPQDELAKVEQSKEDARIALENKVDLETINIPINYHSATAIFKSLTEAKGIGGSSSGENQDASSNSFLSSRGRIVADERTNTLIVSDIPKKLKELRDIIDVIDRPVDQVLIEARLVIATEMFARDLGARFGVFGNKQTSGNSSTIGSTIEGNASGAKGVNSNLFAGGFVNNTASSLAYTLLGRNFSLDMELSAMQEENKGEVISNPRLITSNQREGVIRQGKEIGYVTVTGNGGDGAATPNVQFKEALLELKVTPTITNDNRVFLNLNVKKDEVDRLVDLGVYGAVPSINRREINTAVLLENGQTVVIGGVYEFTDKDSIAKVPFLGDIPFIGNLFKKKGRSKDKAELLVFITPHTMLVGKRPDSTSVLDGN